MWNLNQQLYHAPSASPDGSALAVVKKLAEEKTRGSLGGSAWMAW